MVCSSAEIGPGRLVELTLMPNRIRFRTLDGLAPVDRNLHRDVVSAFQACAPDTGTCQEGNGTPGFRSPWSYDHLLTYRDRSGAITSFELTKYDNSVLSDIVSCLSPGSPPYAGTDNRTYASPSFLAGQPNPPVSTALTCTSQPSGLSRTMTFVVTPDRITWSDADANQTANFGAVSRRLDSSFGCGGDPATASVACFEGLGSGSRFQSNYYTGSSVIQLSTGTIASLSLARWDRDSDSFASEQMTCAPAASAPSAPPRAPAPTPAPTPPDAAGGSAVSVVDTASPIQTAASIHFDGRILGTFEGYAPGRDYQLASLELWRQIGTEQTLAGAGNPDALLFSTAGAWRLHVAGEASSVSVERVSPAAAPVVGARPWPTTIRPAFYAVDSVSRTNGNDIVMGSGAIWRAATAPYITIGTEVILTVDPDDPGRGLLHQRYSYPMSVQHVSGASVRRGYIGRSKQGYLSGQYLRLDDDSVWEVDLADRARASAWADAGEWLVRDLEGKLTHLSGFEMDTVRASLVR